MGWKDYLENNPLVIISGAIVFAGGIGWTVSEKIRVEPRDREITSLNKKVDDAQKNLNELNAAYDPYRKQIQQLLAEKQQLENNLTLYQTNDKGYKDIIKIWEDMYQKSNKECGDTIKQWDKANSDLQKAINKFSANCSIISDIRDLRRRKANLDDLVQRGHRQYQNESSDLHVQVLSLQQRLTCEQ
jgi:hypothetical protein